MPGGKLSCSIFTFSCTDIDILLIDIDILRTTADGRLFLKMLQESLHPGKMILNGYIPLFTMSVQNSVFLYDSIVHPYYKGGSGAYEVSNSIGIIIYYIVPMCNAYTCTYTIYTQYDSVYAMYVHTMYMDGENKVVSAGLGDSNKYIRNSIINSSPYHKQIVYIHYQE